MWLISSLLIGKWLRDVLHMLVALLFDRNFKLYTFLLAGILLMIDIEYSARQIGVFYNYILGLSGIAIIVLLIVISWSIVVLCNSSIHESFLVSLLLLGYGFLLFMLSSKTRLNYVLNDVGLLLSVICGLYLSSKIEYHKKIELFLRIGVFYSLLALTNYFLGYGTVVGSHIRPLADSGRNFISVAVLLVIYKSPKNYYVKFEFLVGLVSLMLIGSRSQLILTLFPIVLLSFKGLRSFLFILILVIVTFYAFTLYTPGLFAFLKWKLTSFDVSSNAGLTSFGVRFMEGMNLLSEMFEDGSLYMGRGWGGYFSDSSYPYLYSLRDTSSYADSIIEMREISNPHGTQYFVLLKLGLIGLLSGAYVLLRRYFKFQSREMFILLFIVLFLFYKAFTIKVQIALGVFIYIFFYDSRTKVDIRRHF